MNMSYVWQLHISNRDTNICVVRPVEGASSLVRPPTLAERSISKLIRSTIIHRQQAPELIIYNSGH